MPKIALTGSTGHLGLNLLSQLLKKGYVVNALIRHHSTIAPHKNLNLVMGNLENVESLSNLIKGADVLIHCASVISLGKEPDDLLFRINVEGTNKLIALCVENKIRLIYLSSSTVSDSTVNRGLFNEDLPYIKGKHFYYAYTKIQSELNIIEAVKHKSLDAFIIRPTAIVGPKDEKPSLFGQVIKDLLSGRLKFIADGGYNLIDVRDLVDTVIKSITLGRKGQIYLVGGHYMSLRQICQTINPDAKMMMVPVQILLILLPVIQMYDRIWGMPWPISKESLSALKSAPINLDDSKAQRELNHQTRPIEHTLADLVTWFNKFNKT